METLFFVLLAITVIFFIFLALKNIFSKVKKIKTKTKNFCVICTSISFTWLTLLILYFLSKFNHSVLIALLIGMSITGIYYYLESKIDRKLRVFRLPFILTLIFITYSLLTIEVYFTSLIFILTLWALFFISFIYRNNKKFRGVINAIIECCKKW